MSRLLHYSAKPITLDRTRRYCFDSRTNGHLKPPGFWVSVEGDSDWKEWCEGEGFALENLACVHEVILAPQHSILLIDNLAAFDAFHAEYDAPAFADIPRIRCPQWSRVAGRHDGMIIAPYLYERRLSRDASWYYGWDCASGVIWNLDAISELRLVQEKAR